MQAPNTLTEAIEILRNEGYTEDFNLLEDCLETSANGRKLLHNEFQVDKFYRFDGMTDPADEVMVYAISEKDGNLRGVLVNGYGIYSEPLTNEMLEHLDIRKHFHRKFK